MHKTSIPKLHSIKFKNGVYADNVSVHPERHRGGIQVMDVLIGAYEADLETVCVFGYKKDGEEIMWSNTPCHKESAYMFSRGHLNMLRVADSE